MSAPHPITFRPLFMERPWGGHHLEKKISVKPPRSPFGAASEPIGELWALVDRPEAQSIVNSSPLAGKTLHELWSKERAAIFGSKHLANHSSTFPLLCKMLDAAQPLSLQVHPNAASAATFHGELKTECWYFLKTEPEAFCYAGLKKGITRQAFAEALQKGDLEKTVHRLTPQPGDLLFIPSGRLHALGPGNLVIEIQQNSDTTYRVFDWNRRDAHGKPRALHLKEAMASIDFEDCEPQLQKNAASIACDYFHLEKWTLPASRIITTSDDFAIITCLTGKIICDDQLFHPGDFFILPASREKITLTPEDPQTTLLCTRLPA